jgi:hypothetical protein
MLYRGSRPTESPDGFGSVRILRDAIHANDYARVLTQVEKLLGQGYVNEVTEAVFSADIVGYSPAELLAAHRKLTEHALVNNRTIAQDLLEDVNRVCGEHLGVGIDLDLLDQQAVADIAQAGWASQERTYEEYVAALTKSASRTYASRIAEHVHSHAADIGERIDRKALRDLEVDEIISSARDLVNLLRQKTAVSVASESFVRNLRAALVIKAMRTSPD